MSATAFQRMRREQAKKKALKQTESKRLTRMRVAEMLDFAKINKIDIPEDITKRDDIMEYIKMALEDKND